MSDDNPQFSLLLPVCKYDHPAALRAALTSIGDNFYVPEQILIVVDGLVPQETWGEIERFSRVVLQTEILQLPENVGLARALNFALKKVKHPWVIRADADDINVKHRFIRLKNEIQQNKSLDILGSFISEVEKDQEYAVRTVPLSHEEIKKCLRIRNPFNHMSVAIRVSKIREVGGYPEMIAMEDYALWCKLLTSGAVAKNLPEVLVRASAGQSFYKRRGGVRLIRPEVMLQSLMVKLGLKSIFNATIDSALRISFYLVPSIIRKLIYLLMFRKRVDFGS